MSSSVIDLSRIFYFLVLLENKFITPFFRFGRRRITFLRNFDFSCMTSKRINELLENKVKMFESWTISNKKYFWPCDVKSDLNSWNWRFEMNICVENYERLCEIITISSILKIKQYFEKIREIVCGGMSHVLGFLPVYVNFTKFL